MSRQERENTERITPGDGASENPMRTGTVTEVREREVNRGPVITEEMRTMMQGAPSRLSLRTWRPVVGGSLAMTAGIWNIIIGAGILLGTFALNIVSPSFLWGYGSYALIGTSAGIALCVLGFISFIGGYSAVRRSSYTLGLIGGIAALVPSPVIAPFVLGIFSVVCTALGRREFGNARNERA